MIGTSDQSCKLAEACNILLLLLDLLLLDQACQCLHMHTIQWLC